MPSSELLQAWVRHFVRCDYCGVDRDQPLMNGLAYFHTREPAPTPKLCMKGRKLRDAWLAEDQDRRTA